MVREGDEGGMAVPRGVSGAPGESSQPRGDTGLAPGDLVSFPPVPIVGEPRNATSKNLVRNGGFEAASDGEVEDWSLEPAESYQVMDERGLAVNGKRALFVEVPGDEAFEARQAIETVGQARYLLRCFVLTGNVAGEARISVRETSEEGIGFSVSSNGVTGTSATWRPLELEFETPLFVKSLAVCLQHVPSAEGGGSVGTVRFDRCELYRLRASRERNSLENGNFAAGKDGLWMWKGSKRVNARQESTEFGLDVPFCVRIDLPSTKELAVSQIVSGLTPGADYVLRGYIKTENVQGDACIEVRHATRGWEAFEARTETVTGTQDWTWVRVRFAMPADSADLAVYLRRGAVSDTPETEGKIWFANCELLRVGRGS